MSRRVAMIVIAVGASMPTSGCDRNVSLAGSPADTAACEEYVKRGLADATVYRRVNVARVDTPMTFAAFKARYMPGETNAAILLSREMLAAKGLSVRDLALTYSTESDGQVRQDAAHCHFALSAGALEDRDTLMRAASAAASVRALDPALAPSGTPKAFGRPLAANCCITP